MVDLIIYFYKFSQKTRLVQEGKPIGVQPENTIQTYNHNKEQDKSTKLKRQDENNNYKDIN